MQSEFQELKTGFGLIEKELKTQGVDTDALLNEKSAEDDDAQQVDDDDNDTFRTVIREFYKEATKRFKRLELLRQESMSAYDTVVKYYGEDPGKLHPDAFFGIQFRSCRNVKQTLMKNAKSKNMLKSKRRCAKCARKEPRVE